MTRTQNGLRFDTPHGLDGLEGAGTVIVPALPNGFPESGARVDERLVEAVRVAHASGARMVSLCTGAFALAAAGVLDGRRATTHWLYTGVLAERHPSVRVETDALWVDEGEVLTSAGRTAGLDLCLHLVREDLGFRRGNQLARRMVAPPHRSGGQAQYVERPIPEAHGLGDVLEWASGRLAERLSVADLAGRAGMSSRSLVRRFHETTGTTPMRWIRQQRLGRARELLESTDLPVEDIARRCGMGDAGNLRHHFVRDVGVTPSGYRRTFRGHQVAAPVKDVSAGA